MWWERREPWQCCLQAEIEVNDHEEGQQDSVKEWTVLSLNEMWREPEDRVAWRKWVSRDASTDWIVYGIQES